MSIEPTQDTVPTPATLEHRAHPLARFFRSTPGAFLILGIFLSVVIGFSIYGGYRAGITERDHIAATAQFLEVRRQYDLAIEDLAAGRPAMAIQRLEFILTAEPNFPSAAQRYNELQATLRAPTATPTPLPTPTQVVTVQDAPKVLAEAQTAINAKDWDTAIQKINALRFGAPAYEPLRVNNLLYTALRNRGIATIKEGKVELGVADLDEAEKLSALDTEAKQYQQWGTIYSNGLAYWGLNWQRTAQTFELLYKLAPNFRDTKTRTRDAHLNYANLLMSKNDPCNAAAQYAAALAIENNSATDDKRKAAEEACKASGGSVSTKTP
ncbi:MAG: hypothetical protein HZB77_13735 [Chloroflexi bacterium]|nr:hypothetical protein [Chloroflexota bacterium]